MGSIVNRIVNRFRYTGQNNKIIIKNSLGAFVVRGLGLLVSFITTPAFIRYFNNNEVLGVWFTMLSILAWFLNFDLGIGNGIRNQLTKDLTLNDELSAKSTISSGFFSISIVSAALITIGVVGIYFIDLNWLFNVSESLLSAKTLRIATISIFIAIMLRFMLTFVSSIFYSMQKSAFNNLLGLIVQVLQLAFVLCFHFQNIEDALIYLSIAYIVITNLPVLLAGVYAFIKPLKRCRPSLSFVTRQRMRQIIGIGTVFFSCQIMYMIIVNTNEFFVTKLYGAAFTADYSFYYRVTSLIATLVTLVMTPIWSVVTKALAEKNYLWLNKLYIAIKKAGVLVVILQFLLIPFLQLIMDVWLGKGVVSIRLETAFAFAMFGSVFVFSAMLSTIACGMARMKVQMYCYIVGVTLKLLFIYLCNSITTTGWDIVVWSNVLALAPYIVFQVIDLNRYFKVSNNCQQTVVK